MAPNEQCGTNAHESAFRQIALDYGVIPEIAEYSVSLIGPDEAYVRRYLSIFNGSALERQAY